MRVFLHYIACVASIFLMSYLFPASAGYGSLGALLAAGLVMCLLYLFIRPLLQLVSIPITLITFGLFSFVVNAGVVKLTDLLVPGFWLRGFWICIGVSLMVSLVDMLLRKKN